MLLCCEFYSTMPAVKCKTNLPGKKPEKDLASFLRVSYNGERNKHGKGYEMRTVGIIAEYDPFHNGHAWQIAEAKRLARADAAVVVMSGFFTQRGEPACLSPFERTACALRGGADLVLLLPAVASLRSAEGFARGGIRILAGLKTDALSFGAETADLDLLRRADLLRETAAVRSSLRAHLDAGLGWAEALQRAVAEADPAASAVLSQPNSVLGLAYLQAARELCFAPEVFPVPRSVSHLAPDRQGNLASASAIRRALMTGDTGFVRSTVPAFTAECCERQLRENRLVRPDALEQAVLGRLRLMEETDYASLPDCSEGLDHLLRKAGREAVRLEDLVSRVSGRRYPRSRIRRLCCMALLGATREAAAELPDCAIVLGVRSGMESLLSRTAPGFTLLTRSRDYPEQAAWMRVESRAADLWALAAGLPAGLLQRSPLLRL